MRLREEAVRDKHPFAQVRKSEVDRGLIAPVSFHAMRMRIPSAAVCANLFTEKKFMKHFTRVAIRFFPALFLIALVAIPAAHGAWTEDEFEKRPLLAYPLPHGKGNIIGNLIQYQ